jgi:SAM-dependent methyltransferase
LRSGVWFGPGQYGGDYERMNALYLAEDPWKLASERERDRFEQTNAMITGAAPGCGSILELGSGEGIQTQYLLQIAPSVTGIEVSRQAVERAHLRLPEVQFCVGRAEDVETLVQGRRFDLITAFEVLYYARDVAFILTELQRLAPKILITNYYKRAGKLAHHFEGPEWTRLEDIRTDGMIWRCDLWCAAA